MGLARFVYHKFFFLKNRSRSVLTPTRVTHVPVPFPSTGIVRSDTGGGWSGRDPTPAGAFNTLVMTNCCVIVLNFFCRKIVYELKA